MRPAVIVMVKAPRAGQVKTRLTPPLAAEEAAALAACFVQDVVNSASRVAGEVIIAYTPADGRATLERLLRGHLVQWLSQRGADLGERLDSVAAQAFAQGFGPLVLIGADSPTLPPSYIAQSINSLAAAEADIALGPTADGGYYLLALRRPAPGLFRDIAWSTAQTYAETARNAARLGLRLLELQPWYDVDTPADLARLRAELLADEEARRRAPATYAWLQQQG